MWWHVQRKVGVGKATLQAGCSMAVSLLARAEPREMFTGELCNESQMPSVSTVSLHKNFPVVP